MSEDLRQQRINKLERIRAAGLQPYPERFQRSHSLADLERLCDASKEAHDAALAKLEEGAEAPAEELPTAVRTAGRVVLWRHMGKLTFATLQDVHGRFQISFQRDDLDPDNELSRTKYKLLQKVVDLGDFLGIEGDVWRTQKGQSTLGGKSFTFLGKALRPLPDKHSGLKDVEESWRRRYLDLITNPESRRRFKARTTVTRSIRTYLDEHGFDEVETPVLCAKASGALARPFMTHHNSLDLEVALRIAPETYLKRLVVGGYDRVYEFARCFRNEGMDPSHLQDFTMLEYYCAYWNYEDNMDFTEALLKSVVEEVNGSLKLDYRAVERDGDGEETVNAIDLDFSGSWPRLSLRELIIEHAGIDIDEHGDAASLKAAIFAKKVDLENPDAGRGSLIDQLYKKTARPKLIQPTFIIKHPKDLSPLARGNDEDPGIVDRFQLVVNTWEIVNAYSELVDPLDQRQRLEDQAKQNAAGDDEAMLMDEDYLEAMEYGMPPISGWGMGIDRFTALLTSAPNLRDTVFFPLLKPKDAELAAAE